MHYIRFLKPPKVTISESQPDHINALITITSDLGESFYADDVTIYANLHSESHDAMDSRGARFTWTAGMRTLPISMDLLETDVSWPARLKISSMDGTMTDVFEPFGSSGTLPKIVSAWSGLVNPPEQKEASKIIERRFTLSNDRVFGIWEETGESIARHVWDAGVALTAYIDRVLALQADHLPLLNATLASATYKKLNVIELGSGCGIVGITLAQMIPDCDVVLTDLPEAAEIINRNTSGKFAAMSSNAHFQVLHWDERLPSAVKDSKFDLIIVADCTYNADSTPALVKTISRLMSRSPKAVIVVAMKVRHASEAVFFELMSEAGINEHGHTEVLLPNGEELNYGNSSETVDIYVFQGPQRGIPSK
ncbi:MAG: hypothetical protein M1827_000739 [Pycnora praestabilis]|nr:MAG: hypothetical protein M1827_000739 [Pycnora praestabilis]